MQTLIIWILALAFCIMCWGVFLTVAFAQMPLPGGCTFEYINGHLVRTCCNFQGFCIQTVMN